MSPLLAFIAGGAAVLAAIAAIAGVTVFLDDRRGPRDTYMSSSWLRELTYRLGKE